MRIGDVVAGGGVVLMVVAVIGMIIELWADVAPGASLGMLFTLGAVAVAAEAARRYERAAARQHSTADSPLQEVRRRRAQLTQHEHTEDTVHPVLLAA